MRALTQPNVTVVWDEVVSTTSDEVTVSSGELTDTNDPLIPADLAIGETFKPDVIALATGFTSVSDMPRRR